MDVTPVPSVRVAVVQAEPVYFDLEGSVEKTIKLISEAASKSAKLVAFPEVWIPGYPSWIWARGCDIDLVQKYIKSSLPLKSPQMTRICEAAALHHIEVVLGYSERDGDSLYLGQSYIGSDGAIKCSRRKIKPTHMERTVFGDGSGNSLLNVVDRPGIGRVGMLCCWEHSQPLLKYHTHSQGEQIHVAAWPAQLPHEEGKGLWSTANEGWLPPFFTYREFLVARGFQLANQDILSGSVNLSVTYAIEGGCFVLHTSTLISSRGVDSMRTADGDQYYAPGGGRSCVIRPDGKIISEFLPDDQEGLVITDLNMDDILRSKAYLDTQGHYSRPDLLWLSRNTEEMKRVRP